MASLNQKIEILKAEIEEYRVDLKGATTPEEKSELRGLINSSQDLLKELLQERRAQSVSGKMDCWVACS